MGFFAKLTGGVQAYKAGRKHAMSGNLEKALVYFDDAVRQAKESKNLYENRIYYYLVLAILFSKKGELEKGREAHALFLQAAESLSVEYDKTPGFGSRIRQTTTVNGIQELIREYLTDVKRVEN